MIPHTPNLARYLAWISIAFVLSQSAHAAGLVLYSTPGSSYVNAVQYVTFTSPSAHLSYATGKDGKRFQIKSAGIIAQIPYPDASTNISVSDIEGIISETETHASQYPQYAKLLQSVGELWKKKLEAVKLAESRSMPEPSAPQSQITGKEVISVGSNSPIPVIKTKAGQTLLNVKISRFEDDKAVISHDGGIGRLSISDIVNLSDFPADAKASVEKVKVAVSAKEKGEADRTAAEKNESERIAKDIEKQRLAQVQSEQKSKADEQSASAPSTPVSPASGIAIPDSEEGFAPAAE